MSNNFFNNLTLCLQCKNYPFLFLDKDKPKELLIKCQQCGYNQYTSIHSYLCQMKDTSSLIHNDKYCHNDESHKLISFENNISTININNELIKGYNHINNYSNEIKNKRINYYIDKINQLEYSYQSFYTFNNDILTIIQLIIHNYNINPDNYYLKGNISNVINSYSFELYKCNDSQSDYEIINYYNNYNILRHYSADINNVKILNEHTKGINSLLLLSDGRLASCSNDKTIKIFNINNDYYCDIIIRGHTKEVCYISELDNNRLISCSRDKSIKIGVFLKHHINVIILLKKHIIMRYL